MRVACYARFSSDSQKETSIEDQIRNCEAVAQRLGVVLSPHLTFSDARISGKESKTHLRHGYQSLMAAWDRREFDILIVDEIPRLARARKEHNLIQELIERTGVRLVTADGLDSASPAWEMIYGFASIMSGHALKELRHRVVRGLVGTLTRGFQIGYPPFGMKAARVRNAIGKEIGTVWEVDPKIAPIVREMFEMRHDGKSLVSIAAELNRRGIRTSNVRSTGGRFWNPSTVRQILLNTVYRGKFVWQGSLSKRAAAKRNGIRIEPITFDREHLRIVSDEVWHGANRSVTSPWRGGGKNAMMGLVRCSLCERRLVQHYCTGSLQLQCIHCMVAVRVGSASSHLGSINVATVEHALTKVFESFLLTEDVLTAYRDRLRQRLRSGPEEELELLRRRLDVAVRTRDRLRALIVSVEDGRVEETQQQYRQAHDACVDLQGKIQSIKDGIAKHDRMALEAQIAADPSTLRGQLFSNEIPVEKLRALLARLFPRILFLGKPSRQGAVFEISFAPGIALAVASTTAVVDGMAATVTVRVERRNKSPTTWHAEIVDTVPPIIKRPLSVSYREPLSSAA